MLSGNILDVYPDYKNNVMITWLITEDKPVKIIDSYNPSFYVYSSKEELYNIASILRDNQVKNLNFTNKKIILGSNKKKMVLEIIPKKLKLLRTLSKLVDSWGGYYRYNLYDVDIRLSTRYLQDKDVFFNANVKWDKKKFILDDEQWAVEYPNPKYKKTNLGIKQNSKKKMMRFDIPIKSIEIGDLIIDEGNEIDTILLAVKNLKNIDPDVIFTKKGDDVLFPYLYHRARLNGIKNKLILGREKYASLNPIKEGKSYFSYGNIVYRPSFYTLKGRAHIDTYNSFIYGESRIAGLIDMSRCSNISLQILSRVGPGTAISQIQVNKARKKGYLIPWKKNMPEGWKTAMDLLISDRGGLILDPAVGLHEDVVELDFASLYPNIMLRYNISPETMLCDCCKNSPNIVVPQIGYHICSRKLGLLPEILKPIIFRRFYFKARSKNKKYDKELYKELQTAWKWVLLVCFGYTGYRNARYGRIECYESITAFSRDILLSALETVEKAGYCVLHGIIDSLWVKPKSGCVNSKRLSQMISDNIGIRMDLEGHYSWIVFLPNKQNGVGALNRYYGLFDNGKIKVRGIELRQKNSPVFLKNMQKDMLKIFSKAKNRSEFLGLIPSVIDIIKMYAKKIINNDFDQEDLIIKSCISRNILDYKVNTFTKCALLEYEKAGFKVEPGQRVCYVVCNNKTRDPGRRVCIAENLDKNNTIDREFYLRQIAQYAESILIPFYFTKEKIYKMLK